MITIEELARLIGEAERYLWGKMVHGHKERRKMMAEYIINNAQITIPTKELTEEEMLEVIKSIKSSPLMALNEKENITMCGHWIATPDEHEICATEFECSVCKECFCTGEMDDDDFIKTMKYCPHCGAKMNKEVFND